MASPQPSYMPAEDDDAATVLEFKQPDVKPAARSHVLVGVSPQNSGRLFYDDVEFEIPSLDINAGR